MRLISKCELQADWPPATSMAGLVSAPPRNLQVYHAGAHTWCSEHEEGLKRLRNRLQQCCDLCMSLIQTYFLLSCWPHLSPHLLPLLKITAKTLPRCMLLIPSLELACPQASKFSTAQAAVLAREGKMLLCSPGFSSMPLRRRLERCLEKLSQRRRAWAQGTAWQLHPSCHCFFYLEQLLLMESRE